MCAAFCNVLRKKCESTIKILRKASFVCHYKVKNAGLYIKQQFKKILHTIVYHKSFKGIKQCINRDDNSSEFSFHRYLFVEHKRTFYFLQSVFNERTYDKTYFHILL